MKAIYFCNFLNFVYDYIFTIKSKWFKIYAVYCGNKYFQRKKLEVDDE